MNQTIAIRCPKCKRDHPVTNEQGPEKIAVVTNISCPCGWSLEPSSNNDEPAHDDDTSSDKPPHST